LAGAVAVVGHREPALDADSLQNRLRFPATGSDAP